MDGILEPKSNSTVTITALATSIVTNSSDDFGCSGAGAGGGVAVRTGCCCLGWSFVPQPENTSNARNPKCRHLLAAVNRFLRIISVGFVFDMEFHSGLQSIKRVTGWATRASVHDEMFVISGFDGQGPINT